MLLNIVTWALIILVVVGFIVIVHDRKYDKELKELKARYDDLNERYEKVKSLAERLQTIAGDALNISEDAINVAKGHSEETD